MNQELLTILMFVFGFIAFLASVAYYFLRFHFKTDVEKGLGESLSPREADVTGEVPVTDASITQEIKVPLAIDTQENNLKTALGKTNAHLWGRLKNIFQGSTLTPDMKEQLEEVLYTSDLGPQAVERLFQAVEEKLGGNKSTQDVREALKEEMLSMLKSQPAEIKSHPHVIMVVGVNGAGKTTTIGKLSHYWSEQNKRVLIIAGDTFRAAARDQLKVWSTRAQVEIFSQDHVQDPSAVAYAGLEKGKAENFDVIIVDTAGRLHTQEPLMEELKKMKRILSKVIPTAPDEVLLVLDANSGQNALIQAKSFHAALGVSSVILTKLDGTAKGGVALGVSVDLGLPISWIGVGEKMSDLRPFQPKEFVDAIL